MIKKQPIEENQSHLLHGPMGVTFLTSHFIYVLLFINNWVNFKTRTSFQGWQVSAAGGLNHGLIRGLNRPEEILSATGGNPKAAETQNLP